MGRLIKYELKGNYKIFFGIFTFAILINGLLLTRLGHWSDPSIIGLMSLVSTAMFITVLIFVEKSFSNEIYQDRGYLTFTLPVSGYKILASKILVGLLWLIISGVISFISFKYLIKELSGQDLMKLVMEHVDLKQLILIGIVYVIVSLVMLLLMMYLSIALTRVAYKGKKMSGFIGCVVFILLIILIHYISYKVGEAFPHEMHITLDIANSIGSDGIIKDGTITVRAKEITVNIARTIYMLVVYIGMFFGTGYLLENKMDI